MDKKGQKTTFFRSISVHLKKGGATTAVFRPIPVQSASGGVVFPEHIRSLSSYGYTSELLFRSIPVHSKVSFRYLCTVIKSKTVHQWQEQ